VPVQLEPVRLTGELSFQIGNLQHLMLHEGDRGEALRRLAQAVRESEPRTGSAELSRG
jgi:hypothetical protein